MNKKHYVLAGLCLLVIGAGVYYASTNSTSKTSFTTQSYKSSSTFIPCPGSDKLIAGEDLILMFTNGGLRVSGNYIDTSPFIFSPWGGGVPSIAAEVGGVQAPGIPGSLICQYFDLDSVMGEFRKDITYEAGCTAINELDRIGFECKDKVRIGDGGSQPTLDGNNK